MQRVRAKVCGITSPEDAELAVNAGADAIGMILHADSPRVIDIDVAKSIRAVLPPFITLVGVVVDANEVELRKLFETIGLDYLQLHGAENAEFAAQLDLPYIRAIRARSKTQVTAEMKAHQDAAAFLLDPYVAGQHGGTGRVLTADLWPVQASKPLILAGGLSPRNISKSVSSTQPFAVDLNSGVEAAPGRKSGAKLNAAFAELAKINKA